MYILCIMIMIYHFEYIGKRGDKTEESAEGVAVDPAMNVDPATNGATSQE